MSERSRAAEPSAAPDKVSLPKAKVRPATSADFAQVLPLLHQLNNTRITDAVWQRLFSNFWQQDNFQPGYVLDTGERIVGFIATLYSLRALDPAQPEQLTTICNLSSWIVEEEYRSSSLFLLMPILRQKDVTFTSLTSSPEAYAIYNKLGFADLDAQARVIYANPLMRGKGYRISTDPAQFVHTLSKSEQRYCRDHQLLDCTQLLIERGDNGGHDYCYCVGEIKRGKVHLHYVSNPYFFREHIGDFRTPLLKALAQKCLQVDERLLAGRALLLSRKKRFSQPKQYKSPSVLPAQIDGLYSELLMLATPPQ